MYLLYVLALVLPFVKSDGESSEYGEGECVVGDTTYQNDDQVGSTSYICTGHGAIAHLWTSYTTYCRNGELKGEEQDGECSDQWKCCQVGTTTGCVHPDDECSPQTCTHEGTVYEDNALVEPATYECVGWGAAASQWVATEKYCRDGTVKEESLPGQCANGWSCCPMGDTAGCVVDWTHCETPTYCEVDGETYQDGEVIRDVRHDCADDDEYLFAITQEVCRSGSIAVETFPGSCDTGVCCQYGDFVGCTSPSCEVEGKDCFVSGKTYEHRAVIPPVIGYTCPFWGAGQSEVQVHENVCDDGELAVQTRSIPCDHNWACCQIGKSAMCAPSGEECPSDRRRLGCDNKSCACGGGCTCFSGDNRMWIKRDGVIQNIQLKELQIGDYAQTKESDWSKVWFIKEEDSQEYDFLALYFAQDEFITMTNHHLLYVDDMTEEHMKRADQVKIGDIVFVMQQNSTSFVSKEIVSIESRISSDGAYAPVTMEGSIVVNNVLASCYVESTQKAQRLHDTAAIFRWISSYNTNVASSMTHFFYDSFFMKLRTNYGLDAAHIVFNAYSMPCIVFATVNVAIFGFIRSASYLF